MEFKTNAYSIIFSEHNMSEELEYGNKILLPSTLLPDINLDKGTVYFTLSNGDLSISCGVHEYMESESVAFMPHSMLERLELLDGNSVTIKQLNNVPNGEYIKIKPYEKEFIELVDPKALLERMISVNYPILSEGEVICIKHNEKEYHIEVTECLPEKTIQTTNCNINVEFERPVDMPEETKETSNAVESFKAQCDLKRFPGKGNRLGSC
jgi:ubiquitin fusion degradation protein 1